MALKIPLLFRMGKMDIENDYLQNRPRILEQFHSVGGITPPYLSIFVETMLSFCSR